MPPNNEEGSVLKRIAAIALVLVTACGGDSTSPVISVAGTWNLQTINGATLPFVVQQSGANKAEITADVLTVTSTGSFTQLTSTRTTVNGVATNGSAADAGSYTTNGNTATFHFNSDGSSGTAVFDEHTLTTVVVGTSFIYKR